MYGENIGKRERLEKTLERERVCLEKKHGRDGMFKENIRKGYVNRKHEREYVAYASEPGGGCLPRVCLENTCKREYVWMFGATL